MTGKKALFLDRDGVINDLVFYPSSGEWEAPRATSDVTLIDGVGSALRAARDAGWHLFIVSNQPSHAKGKMSREAVREVQDEVLRQLPGVTFDGIYFCLHHPAAVVAALAVQCECRKPGSALLLDAAREHGVDLNESWMAGDCDTDIVAGRGAGCRTALLQYPHSSNRRGAQRADIVCSNLGELVRNIIVPTI
jgi:D-glycero-D-manno-heptose 1,7-bisphosphate phosphatase